jgi:hypothetical protein
MGPENDEFIAKRWQAAIEINGNLIATININLKTGAFKVFGGLVDEGLVGLKRIKLVNDSGLISLDLGARC